MFDFDVLDRGEVESVDRLGLDAPVTAIPRGPALTLSPGTAVASALQAMRARHRGGVIVVENHRPIGVVTDRDILGRVRAEVEDLGAVALAAIMVPCTAPLCDSDTVGDALRTMCAQRQWFQPIVCSRGLVLGALEVADISLWLRDHLTVMSVDACLGHGG
jgi:CBS domain-containing protein